MNILGRVQTAAVVLEVLRPNLANRRQDSSE